MELADLVLENMILLNLMKILFNLTKYYFNKLIKLN